MFQGNVGVRKLGLAVAFAALAAGGAFAQGIEPDLGQDLVLTEDYTEVECGEACIFVDEFAGWEEEAVWVEGEVIEVTEEWSGEEEIILVIDPVEGTEEEVYIDEILYDDEDEVEVVDPELVPVFGTTGFEFGGEVEVEMVAGGGFEGSEGGGDEDGAGGDTEEGGDPEVYDNPDSECGGCEAWDLVPEFTPTTVNDGPVAGAGARSGAVHRAPSIAPAPNLCMTPELYVQWLCEWQGYEKP